MSALADPGWWQRVRSSPRGATLLAPLTVLVSIVVLLAVGGVLAPGFLAPSNVLTLLSLSSYLGIAAIGETVVILTGGVDLSIAWTIAAAGLVFTDLTQGQDAALGQGLAAALGIGLAAGLINGIGIAKLRISPIVMTLGMNNVMQGVALIYTQGTPSGSSAPAIKTIATGWFGPLPIMVVLWLVLTALVMAWLHLTRSGRYVFSVGESPLVSRLSGIDNDGVLILAYAVSGVGAALTGVLFSGFSGMSYLGMGDQFVLPAIAAVVLGGTSILGGRGGYAGTAIGAFFLTVLTTILAIINISAGFRNIIYGLVIVAAVLLHRTYSRYGD